MKHYDKSKWKLCLIADCLDYEQPGKYIIHTDIIPMLRNIPVLTANKSFIIGYTEESDNIYDKGAVIIYDDFTMDMKYVDFAFKVKSSAIKLLTAKPGYNLYFIYSILKQMNLSQQEHARSYISKVGRMYIPIPDLAEQTKIADQLSKIDEHISNLEALISKQEAIKKTTQFLLLQPKDNWNKITLGDICDITGAGVDKKINPNEERCVLLNYLDVYHKTYIYSSDLHHVVSAPKKQKLRCSVKKNDIFFTPSSETPDDIARSCVAMEDMQDVAYSYHIVRARPKVECNSLFIKYMCSTNDFLLQAQTACVGSGKRYVISLPKFREFVIYMPDIEEQNKIATQLSEIDAHIENLKQQLAKQRAIKQGLMDYFFGN